MYNSMENTDDVANPVAVKGTYYLYDAHRQRHCELSQGIDCFSEISGPSSFDWRVGRKG